MDEIYNIQIEYPEPRLRGFCWVCEKEVMPGPDCLTDFVLGLKSQAYIGTLEEINNNALLQSFLSGKKYKLIPY